MGSEKSPINHYHSQEVKRLCTFLTLFTLPKLIIQVAVCVSLTRQILSYFQRTCNGFLGEPECMNVFLWRMFVFQSFHHREVGVVEVVGGSGLTTYSTCSLQVCVNF